MSLDLNLFCQISQKPERTSPFRQLIWPRWFASPLSQAILSEKFRDMLAKRRAMSEQIDLFQNTHLQGKTLREVINSGERSFSEFIPILRAPTASKAQFLKNADINAGLLAEYYENRYPRHMGERSARKVP